MFSEKRYLGNLGTIDRSYYYVNLYDEESLIPLGLHSDGYIGSTEYWLTNTYYLRILSRDRHTVVSSYRVYKEGAGSHRSFGVAGRLVSRCRPNTYKHNKIKLKERFLVEPSSSQSRY